MSYDKYRIIHIMLGYYSNSGTVALFWIYQLYQLFTDKRFFLFENCIEEGNSVSHTVMKLYEFYFGRLLAGKTTDIFY